MARKFLLFILLVFSKILFSAEVTLRSENVFICDIVDENSTSITILYQEQKYKIPRSEILTVNSDLSGKHSSYQNTIITLEDKSVVKGRLTEETPEMITIQKEKDEFAIPKNTIQDIKRPVANSYLFPESYKIMEKQNPTWTIGLYASGFKNGREVGLTNYSTYGGGLFIEPAFAKINERFLFGIQSEFFNSVGSLTYTFFQNFLYLHFNHTLLGQNIYYKVGIGTSYVSMVESNQTVKIFRLAATGELGWQNIFADKYILRIGIRENGIFENPKLWDAFGLQISFGYRL